MLDLDERRKLETAVTNIIASWAGSDSGSKVSPHVVARDIVAALEGRNETTAAKGATSQ